MCCLLSSSCFFLSLIFFFGPCVAVEIIYCHYSTEGKFLLLFFWGVVSVWSSSPKHSFAIHFVHWLVRQPSRFAQYVIITSSISFSCRNGRQLRIPNETSREKTPCTSQFQALFFPSFVKRLPGYNRIAFVPSTN